MGYPLRSHLAKSKSRPVASSSSSQGGTEPPQSKPYFAKSKPGLNPKEEVPRDSVSKSQSMPWGSENGGSSGGATTRKEALLPPISTSAVISSAVNTETQSVLVSATSSSALSPNHADTDSTTACDNTGIVDIVVPAGKTGFVIDSS